MVECVLEKNSDFLVKSSLNSLSLRTPGITRLCCRRSRMFQRRCDKTTERCVSSSTAPKGRRYDIVLKTVKVAADEIKRARHADAW